MNPMNPLQMPNPPAVQSARPPRPSPQDDAPTADAAFAQRLQQARERAAPPPSAARPEAGKPAAAPSPDDPRAQAADEAGREDKDDARAHDAPVPGDAWLQALQLAPAQAAAGGQRAGARGEAGDASAPGLDIAALRSAGRPAVAADGAAGEPTLPGVRRDGDAPGLELAAARRAAPAEGAADAHAQAVDEAQALAAAPAGPQAEAASAPALRHEPAALPLPASSQPLSQTSTPAAGATAAPFQAQLAAALDSPQFGPALGAQLSLLVREGVQEARLQLNPAEMGPVSVQIALDGVQARVEFRADLAATRAALEASLPDLAAALSDSGLLLAGGGVFEQRRGEAGGEHAGRPAGAAANSRSGGDGAAAAPAATPRSPRGMVDLYA